MSNLHQKLMDRAYGRWTDKRWTKEEFWDQLTSLEKTAVALGNMNCQVQNGGWRQWHDNGYDTPQALDEIGRTLRAIGTPTAITALDLCSKFEQLVADQDPEDLDENEFEDWSDKENAISSTYYEIDDLLMEEVDVYLHEKLAAARREIDSLLNELEVLA